MKKTFLFIFFSYFIFYFLFPPFQNPDEQAHYAVIYWASRAIYPIIPNSLFSNLQPGNPEQALFANVVQHTQYIPNFANIKASSLQKQTDYSKVEKQEFTPFAGQAYNPPLYYITATIPLWIARALHTSLLSQIYIVRLTSTIFYFLTIFIAYKALLYLFRKESVTNALTLVFALNPLLMQAGIGISPDIAIVFFSTLFFFLSIKLQKFSKSNITILGVVAGLAILSKTTGLILIPGFLIYLFYQEKNKCKIIQHFFLFLLVTFLAQAPWMLLNTLRYHTPIMAVPAIGFHITNVHISPVTAIVTSLWGFRHVFMHFSGFLGWNEAYLFPPIFIAYTILFAVLCFVGIYSSWKNKNSNKLMITSVASLFLLFFALDVIRKLYANQGWETGGRDALLVTFPFLLFTIKGFTVLFHKRIEETAKYFGYFAIWYYYLVIIFVLLPRYYV